MTPAEEIRKFLDECWGLGPPERHDKPYNTLLTVKEQKLIALCRELLTGLESLTRAAKNVREGR